MTFSHLDFFHQSDLCALLRTVEDDPRTVLGGEVAGVSGAAHAVGVRPGVVWVVWVVWMVWLWWVVWVWWVVVVW